MHFKGQIYNSFHNNANIFEKNETENTPTLTIKKKRGAGCVPLHHIN